MRDPTEEELDACMARLAQGERAAFDPLFRALYPRAMRLARRELASDRAADAAQSVLMKVFARAGEFQAGKPVLPWFYAMAASELRTLRRRGAAERSREAAETLAADLPGPDDPEGELVLRELKDSLARAIASLDDDSALAIASMLHGAERPCVTATAFRKRVSRAYARLRWLLGVFDGQ
ncbi:MAG TPA: RNA polymerase sigma factor [Polyangiaceae bacterium]|nr:RNA polymerase sigma factor [Polyangiaceae bacterium]